MPSWLTTILSVIAGGALAMISTWIADKRLTERERERRREERRDHRAIRRDDFQRETLLALQVAVQRLLRATGAMHHHDEMAFRDTGKWHKGLFPEGLSNEHFQQNVETMLLASRVRDGEVRTLADRLRDHTSTVPLAPDQKTSDSHMSAAADVQIALIERIGQLIRELDETD